MHKPYSKEFPLRKHIRKKGNKISRPFKAKYSLTSYILLFFCFSFIGWVWEVLIYLFQTKSFVNRGFIHGPILPIYGSGVLLILLLFRRIYHRPLLTFFLIMLTCSTIEYYTSLFLEKVKGIAWWDYTSFPFNFQGRICLLGAIVFGIGGMYSLYYLAPTLNNYFKKYIPPKIQVVLCIILVFLFAIDGVYSCFHPNTGHGISMNVIGLQKP